MPIYTFFKSKISIWSNFKFLWDTPYIWQIIFKAFCSRGTLQINHSYSKTEYTQRQDARAPCDAELWGSECAHAWPCGQKALMESYGRHKPPGSEGVHGMEGSLGSSFLLTLLGPGPQHLRTPWTSCSELSTEKHKLLC